MSEALQRAPHRPPERRVSRSTKPPRPEVPVDDVHLRDYLHVIYRRRRLILASLALVVTTASLYGYLVPEAPVYEARVQLLIETENANPADFKEVVGQGPLIDYYETQYKILRSRTLARKVREKLKPQERQAPIRLNTGSSAVRNAIFAVLRPPYTYLRALLGGSDVGARAPGAVALDGDAAIIDDLLAHVTVAPVEGSRLVDLKFQSLNPVRSMQVVNALAHAYIEQNIETKLAASKQAADWLQQRLEDQRKQVEVSEAVLQKYREQNDTVEERLSSITQRLGSLNELLIKARTDRMAKETADQQLQGIRSDRAALMSFPAMVSNPQIPLLRGQQTDQQQQEALLLKRYGDLHPDVTKARSALQATETKLEAEIARVVQSVHNDYLAAQGQERTLSQAVEAQKTETLALNRKAIEFNVLQRNAASDRAIFDRLLQRAKETEITGELRATNVRIIDEAEPPRGPIGSPKRRNLTIFVMLGAVASIGLAFGAEYLDSRIKSPDEVEALLGIPFLGLIPRLKRRFVSSATPLIGKGVPETFGEAFRSVRTGILLSQAGGEGRVFMVTSAAPGEGKTLVASNLAIALAQTGRRVLVADLDMRRPRVHALFGQPLEPGLSDVLADKSKAAEVVRQTAIPGLWLMSAGRPTANPGDLVGSTQFTRLVAAIGEHFDFAVLDTPPVLAVADALSIAPDVSGVVFVVNARKTPLLSARTAIEKLDAAGATFFGCVLNEVDLERDPHSYAPYFKREYVDYATTQASQTGVERSGRQSVG